MADFETYKLLQRLWVEDNHIVTGSHVKVARRAINDERGWTAGWDRVMDGFVDNVYMVREIVACGILLRNAERASRYFPCFVLEPSGEPVTDATRTRGTWTVNDCRFDLGPFAITWEGFSNE